MIINNPVPATQDVKVTSVPAPLDVAIADNADSQAPYGAAGLLAILARLQGFDGADYDRLRAQLIADGIADGQYSLLALSQLMGFNGSAWDRIRSGLLEDSIVNSASAADVRGFQLAYNGSTWDRRRSANTINYAQGIIPGTGTITVWTPASGKKFRLMSYVIDITGDAAVAGAAKVSVEFLDGGVGFGVVRQIYLPATAGTTMGGYTFSDTLGNGYLSAAANNVLGISVNFAFTSGNLSVCVQGVEE